MTFTELKLDYRLVEALRDQDITDPTPIQKRAIPSILAGKDVIGISPTGTGKTFAFLLPAIHWLLNSKITHDDPSILIIVPTRELVKQTQENIKLVTKNTEVFSTSIVAGVRDNKQKRQFKELIEIIVATPGRLNQFIDDEVMNLKNIGVLIIDEIDRMLDMGFQIEIKSILAELSHKNKRQTLLFCSTLPSPVEQMAKVLQNKSHLVEVGRSISPTNITHEIYEVTKAERFDVLIEILNTRIIESVLIFTRSHDAARITTRNLLKAGLDCEEFHGGLTQRQRNKAIENFSSGIVNVLVATDIASRGIDIQDISHIINFDVPKNYDDYLHRAGRTGRINKKGTSIILATPEDSAYINGIKKNLKTDFLVKRELPESKEPSKSPFQRRRKPTKKPSTYFSKKPLKRKTKRGKPFRKAPRRR
ncbi:MAG: DEAD/DEAH box helicase [Candidatus Heimdallarchaeota archaeon]|nr:DEAD/DEAH box helicase [Candidatus Heimdallarchaeota archaeon]